MNTRRNSNTDRPVGRRTLALLGLGTATASACPLASPDADLVRLLGAWRRNIAEYHRLADLVEALANGEAEAEWLAAYRVNAAESRAIEAAINATPAQGLGGMRAKAEVASYGGACEGGDVLQSLLADILATGAAA